MSLKRIVTMNMYCLQDGDCENRYGQEDDYENGYGLYGGY